MNILKGHPDSTHESMGVTMEVHSITVEMLLATHWKIQRLEAKGLTSEKNTEKLQDHRMQGQFPHSCALIPAILQT
ncbi:hypothetical protein VB737_08290 [Synechococcus sp. BA-120 BA3]|nr:hypothetical protein [Synechococcus sp. BA-120 BA3]